MWLLGKVTPVRMDITITNHQVASRFENRILKGVRERVTEAGRVALGYRQLERKLPGRPGHSKYDYMLVKNIFHSIQNLDLLKQPRIQFLKGMIQTQIL